MTAPTGGEAVDPRVMSERELLDRVGQALDRVVWEGILSRASTPEGAQLARRILAERTSVGALEGLTAGARLVEAVDRGRWLLMRAAREDGASWEQVGATVGMTGEQARAWYADEVDAHERYVAEFYDTARDRAVLDDTTDTDTGTDDAGRDDAGTDEVGESDAELLREYERDVERAVQLAADDEVADGPCGDVVLLRDPYDILADTRSGAVTEQPTTDTATDDATDGLGPGDAGRGTGDDTYMSIAAVDGDDADCGWGS